jgi:hypothetical protein
LDYYRLDSRMPKFDRRSKWTIWVMLRSFSGE